MSCGKTTPFFHPWGLQGLLEETRHLLPLLRRTCAQPIDQCPRLSTLQMPGVDILRMKSTKKMKKKHHKSCFDEWSIMINIYIYWYWYIPQENININHWFDCNRLFLPWGGNSYGFSLSLTWHSVKHAATCRKSNQLLSATNLQFYMNPVVPKMGVPQ